MLSDKMTRNCSELRSLLGKEVLIFDGGMGSQLQARGMVPGELPEAYNLTDPEMVTAIHGDYLAAGSDCITTNTFGANRYRVEESGFALEDIIRSAVSNGRKAIEAEAARRTREGVKKKCFLVQDIGPIGQLMAPMGTLSFEDAYETFREQVVIGKDLADAFLIETMSDLYEMKAAVLAVKENSDLPVFATMTFESNGRTLMGASPDTVVAFLEGIGVDALGVNCSLGPKEIAPIVEEILAAAHIPVLVQPNAGLPVYEGNKATYNVTMEEFSSYIRNFVLSGASAVGGCCGTTPDYIRSASALLRGETLHRRDNPRRTMITSGNECVEVGGRIVICGERLNPTGKKKLKEALLGERYDEVLLEAIRQEQAGADVLDVNVGLPGIDEGAVMTRVVRGIQDIISLPLQIDSSSPDVIEKACRIYNGKPLINSVNGKREVMEAVFPIVKKYGGVVLGLTLDESGIPPRAEDRLAIARSILSCAESYGIDRSDVMIDCLVLTASAQQKEVAETLRAVSMVRSELRVHTVLGCSNVSFGLPNRPLINKTFMAMALYAGLDMPIMNPLDGELMAAVDAFEVLSCKDPGSARYIAKHAGDQIPKPDAPSAVYAPVSGQAAPAAGPAGATDAMSLRDMVVSGMKSRVGEQIRAEIKAHTAMEIINSQLIPGLDEVGKKYEAGQIFLPQLIQSAETAKAAFGVLKDSMAASGSGEGKGPVLLATVEGDIHDIGKNIVRVVLESYGFRVVDLGKDVAAEKVAEAFLTHRPKLIGLSALMTTTVANMEKTIRRLREIPGICPIVVGGAVLTEGSARQIGADYFAKDALGTAEIAQKVAAG